MNLGSRISSLWINAKKKFNKSGKVYIPSMWANTTGYIRVQWLEFQSGIVLCNFFFRKYFMCLGNIRINFIPYVDGICE